MDIFLERGLDQTTMEQIASSIGMSKRTVYAYYEDKEALFTAAVRRAIERYTVPREVFDEAVTDDIEETLLAVARIRIANLANPVSIKLQRILMAQSHRFPDLFDASFQQGTGPAIEFLRDFFSAHTQSNRINAKDPERAASAFLSLVIGGPARRLVSGVLMDEAEIEAHIRFAVRLFLDGVQYR